MFKFSFLIAFIAAFSLLVGCATYQSNVSPARDHLTGGRCPEALQLLQTESDKVNGDQLVYLLDYGTALQICGDYKKSSKIFQQADKVSEEVDYHSASRLAGATLLNEEMIQYKGDTFEKLFINAAAALNYLEMGEPDDAMVEVRRINEKFNKLNSENKKKFELNSFSQYLSGLIYESQKRYDDACISYKSSYEIDSTYRTVGLDMLRGCWLARRTQEFEGLVKKVGATEQEIKMIKQKNKNEVMIVFMQGWGPRKAPRPGERTIPYLIPTPSVTKSLQAEVSTGGESAAVTKYVSQPIYNVEKAAIQTLEDDHAALIARRIGARVAKEVVADQVRQKDQLLGTLAWVAMIASERADLRQWSTLPQTIQVIHMPMPSGPYKIKLTGLSGSNSSSETWPDIDATSANTQSSHKKIFLVRSLK
ncbi:MAG: hypothetical protein H7328_00380 [Bdellovibrio sp.]|nr:hypothetical protein [Bdellovibrio sp.]